LPQWQTVSGNLGLPLKQIVTKALKKEWLELWTPNLDQKLLPFQNKDPMYTCSLEGCKSAWGSASEMYNHLTSNKNKHNRSYLTKYYEIPNLTVDQIFNKSLQVFEEKKTENNNRVDVNIKQVSNSKQYKELKNRDLNWSEKTARREK
jgi:hypothetical protein